MNEIKTRFAPSPTGYLHVGGLRTALYNFLFARKNKGEFLLRIEDTDRARLVEGAGEQIVEIFKKFKLNIDNEKVAYQSERLDIYKKYAEQLVSGGKAYYCFCTSEKLKEIKDSQKEKKLPPGYWGEYRCCNKLNVEEAEKRIEGGEKYVIRFKMLQDDNTSEEKMGVWEDLVHGEIKADMNLQEDFIIIKSDGFPTYNFANVIDDSLMEVSHVIRGEEFISSTIKHIKLYEALDFKLPLFAHLPLLLNSDKSKLSKRQGDVAVEDYLKKGYLEEAILNFVAFLGWNPKTDQEIFILDELIEQFSLDKVNKSGAIFNVEKLDWFNEQYIRKMDTEGLLLKCLPFLLESDLLEEDGNTFKNKLTGEEINKEWIKKIITLEQERLTKLSDLPGLIEFFFKDKLDFAPELLIWKKSNKEETVKNLEELERFLNEINDFSKGNLETVIKKYIQEKCLGVGDLLWPFRVALSGEKTSPPPFEIAEILEKDIVLKRVGDAILLLK